MPRYKKKKAQLDENGSPLDPTSSLHRHFMCVCKKIYKYRSGLLQHVDKCPSNINNISKKIICDWCNLEFKNMGNLINHRFYMHGCKRPTTPTYQCDVCDERFTDRWKVRFHIRRKHFNLIARIPHANTKKTNQVWFEHILHPKYSHLVMQITKTNTNSLLMKPMPYDASLDIHSVNNTVDLRSDYRYTGYKSFKDAKCRLCGKVFRKCDLKKHMDEIHYKVAKHKCNYCLQTFKRSYIYLQHVCNKPDRRACRGRINGVKHVQSSEIRITSVGSLDSVLID